MDGEEFESLLRRHARLIHKVAFAYCREASDREDVFQEVALQLWHARHRYDGRASETTWVYRIALNVAISFYRRERRHRAGRLSLEAHPTAIAAPDTTPGDDVQLLRRYVDGLGALDKALVLLYLDGNDHAAIADVLGISVSNVSTKLLRVKAKLRAAVDEHATSAGASHGTR